MLNMKILIAVVLVTIFLVIVGIYYRRARNARLRESGLAVLNLLNSCPPDSPYMREEAIVLALHRLIKKDATVWTKTVCNWLKAADCIEDRPALVGGGGREYKILPQAHHRWHLACAKLGV